MNFDKVWVIACEIYRKILRSVSFWIMVFVPVIVVLIGFLLNLIFAQGHTTTKIGIYSQDKALRDILVSQKSELHLTAVTSLKSAQSKLHAETLDHYVVVEEKQGQLKAVIYGESEPLVATKTQLQQLLNGVQVAQRAQQYALTEAQVKNLLRPVELTEKKLTFTDKGEVENVADKTGNKALLGLITCIFTMMLVMNYASVIAQEIAGEKGRRIMEVILASTSAQTHFYGKLLGLMLALLTQLAATFALVGGALLFMRDNATVKDLLHMAALNELEPSFVTLLLLFMVFGVFFYIVLSALCGSLVERAEDTSKAIMPVTTLVMIGYMIGVIISANDPSNIFAVICSYLPFFSMLLVPGQLASGAIGIGGASISLAILGASTVLLLFVAAKMYRINVLIYNQKGLGASLWQAMRSFRNQEL